MNLKIMLIAIALLSTMVVILFVTRTDTPPLSTGPTDKQKAAHDAFVGAPPTPSKPYNILDYTH